MKFSTIHLNFHQKQQKHVKECCNPEKLQNPERCDGEALAIDYR